MRLIRLRTALTLVEDDHRSVSIVVSPWRTLDDYGLVVSRAHECLQYDRVPVEVAIAVIFRQDRNGTTGLVITAQHAALSAHRSHAEQRTELLREPDLGRTGYALLVTAGGTLKPLSWHAVRRALISGSAKPAMRSLRCTADGVGGRLLCLFPCLEHLVHGCLAVSGGGASRSLSLTATSSSLAMACTVCVPLRDDTKLPPRATCRWRWPDARLASRSCFRCSLR
jgi:hypothetical protein